MNAAEKGTRFGAFAPQHVELVSKNQNFRLAPGSRPDSLVSAYANSLRKSIIGNEHRPICGCSPA
jgi:hypothetical protein